MVEQLAFNQLVLGSSPSPRICLQTTNYQLVTEATFAQVDTISNAMDAPSDKMATTHAEPNQLDPHTPAPKRSKHGKPVAMAKFGSANVPV